MKEKHRLIDSYIDALDLFLTSDADYISQVS